MKLILRSIALCVLGCQLHAQVSFTLSSTLSPGNYPQSVAATDVNGDGKLDLINANGSDNTLTVLTNNGSGGFAVAHTYPVGANPQAVIAADVNGDGKLDVICVNENGNTLSVLTNNGSGGFVLSSSPIVGTHPWGFTAADVNGDGKVDLISANFSDNTLSVLTNKGNGGFVLASSPGVGSNPISVAAADVNGDGKVDLISANGSGNTLSVLTNNGSGGFVLANTYAVGNNPRTVVTADINGDGKLDLISANFDNNTLSILTNNGSGGFVLASSPSAGSNPYGLTSADVNGDGKVDLISANVSDNTLSVLTNNGSGGFVLAASPSIGSGAECVVAADINGDGKVDLISANAYSSSLSVLTNATPFSTQTTSATPVITLFTPQSGTVGTTVTLSGINFSATASADIVYFGAVQANVLAASPTSLQVTVPVGAMYAPITVTVNGLTAYASQPFMPTFTGSGQVSFPLSSSPGVGNYPYGVTAADVNGDGKVDLISANLNGNTLSVLTNDGSGNYVLASSPSVGSRAIGVVAADVNGDGKLDLACANNGNNTVSVLTNNGSGGFVTAGTYAVGSSPYFITAADVNGDGNVDLITANQYGNSLSVLTNNGSGGFVLAASPGVGSNPISVTAADVNGDGKVDLISANISDNTLSVLTNNGSGGFATAGTYAVGNMPYSVTAADVNGDGKPDLISANSTGNTLSVLTNNGSGGFMLASSPGVGSQPVAVTAADVNGDGEVDLICANASGNTLSVLTNNGSGGFALAISPAVGNNPRSVVAVDVNGDGKQDLICANASDSSLSILTNTTPFSTPTTPPCNPAPSGLVSWWPGEGNASDIVGANNGTPTGGITYANGEVGQAFVFNGSTTYIPVPASPSLNIGATGSGITIEGWIKPNQLGPVGAAGLPIVEWDSASTDGLQLWVETNFRLFANIVDTANNSHVIASGFNLISSNNFQHVALTYDKSSGTAMLYINGTMVASNNFGNITPQTTYGMNIGRRTGQPIGNGDTFNGLIDELSLYNRALSSAEIAAIYNAGSSGKCPPAAAPPVVPTISSFTPATGTNGIVITITGTNFSATAAADIVYFGAVQAAVLAASPTSLQVTVPVGATFAPITVTVNGLTAYAEQPFMPTFPGSGQIDNSSLAPRLDLATGNGPGKVVIADLDGDGKPDLIIADSYAGEISIYRNISTNGSLTAGSFAPRVDLPLLPTSGTSPYTIVAADLDGDGRLDIIAINADSNVISILRNISSPGSLTTGSFAARMDLPAGNVMRALAVQDLNGDGKPEIVAANQTAPGSISIFQNMSTIGNIVFAARVDFVTGDYPVGIAIGDLDGDGKPDVAVANYNSATISVFRNLGTGGNISINSFAPKVDFPALASPFPIAIGDMDGDGKLDLVVGGNNGSQAISVYRNTATPGSITTSSFAPRVDFAAPGWVNTLALADLDGDGKLDVAMASQLSSVFSIFKNVSTPGSFTTASLAGRVDYSAGWNPNGVAVGDLDGDGRPDIIFGNSYDNTISIYRNIVPGASSVTTPVPVITSFTPQSGTIGTTVTITGTNFSATAAADIVYFGAVQANVLSASPTSLQVTVPVGATYAPITVTVNGLTAYASQPFMPTFTGSGQFSFTLSSSLSVSVNPESVLAADVNGDGMVDLICAHTSGNTLSVLTNNGGGNFVLSSSPVVGSSPWGVAAADVNGDGRLDLICANRSGNTLSVLTNNGSGGFVLSSSPVVGSGPFGVTAADVNGDGMVDLICANKDANTLSVLTNNGHGGFATAGTYGVGSEPSTVVAADINGDGKPDLICANSSGNTLSVLTNNGSGGFVLSSSPVVDSNPYGLVAADVNGDGKVDLISSGGSMLLVLTNNGFGGFMLASSLPVVGSSHFGDVASDVNGDGKVDLIYVNGSTLLVFTNNGSGVFGLAAAPVEGSSPYTIAAADVNGDGRPDLICANYFNNTLSILTNTTLLPPVADATATVPLVISVNNSNATVVLNGSLSSDPNGNPLQYTWYQTGSPNPLASGVIAIVVLPVGTNSITLVVNDGLASSQQTITVTIITLAQAVDQLEAVVNANVAKQQSLIATLNAALGAIDRSNPTAAINQLQAFQNKVSAQISPLDPALAQTLIDSAQSIINALSGGGVASHKALKAAAQGNGKLHLNFSGIHQQVYIIEASTNLVDWQMIGVANDLGDGTFDFDDAVSTKIPGRFYRIVTP